MSHLPSPIRHPRRAPFPLSFMPTHNHSTYFSYLPAALSVVVTILGMSAGRAEEASDSVPGALQEQGAAIFRDSCADCHGSRGEGVEDAYPAALVGDLTISGLAKIISNTMPEGEPQSCEGEDALAVATWMHQAFYGEAARIRNHPPRLALARLTGVQLRQSLADLYAHQTGIIGVIHERGVLAEYFDAANFSKESRKIERTDATIDFDFGSEGPGSDIDPKEYSITWKAGLLPMETGSHEIIIRSSCSFTCQLGNSGRLFIDNHVQSGDKTEFRKSIELTGGRVYPLQIKFRQRKRKTEQPPGNISLSWIPPHGVEQIIPVRQLLPTAVPAVFALQTWLPPDDRSYGFERGIAVDREWDDSITSAAIEFARVAATDLWPRYQRQHKEESDEDRKQLRAFLLSIVNTAFRGPVNEATRVLYIDSQIEDIQDDAQAIRQVILATLKSPRFLYPALDSHHSASRQHANRLTLTLFDSLPADRWLLDQIDHNAIETQQQIRNTATRMVDDYRTQHKTRELMTEWLNLGRLDEISKDEDIFPGFDTALADELRQSLFQFLDGVIWSESSDYRDFFSTRPEITSPVATAFYQTQAADNKPEDKSSADDTALGLLTHPYLMSGLAYRDSTSPIHRGVFLMRHLLGRTLRPPNEAFTPLSPELHPDLTTRERVQLQTGAANCQTCHRKINGLGFVLENLDAVGRYRTEENGRVIQSNGIYETRSGEEVTFDGPAALAKFLANSDDAHRAFVHRTFLHFVKQPPGAWGPDTLNHLTRTFQTSNFSIRDLLIEIAVTTARPPQTSSAEVAQSSPGE